MRFNSEFASPAFSPLLVVVVEEEEEEVMRGGALFASVSR
jgi:hypothetical protein